jgi:hypothetical protein
LVRWFFLLNCRWLQKINKTLSIFA